MWITPADLKYLIDGLTAFLLRLTLDNGLIDGQLSFRLVCLFTVLFIGSYAILRLRSSRHTKSRHTKYGWTPRTVPYNLPFGLDTLWEAIQVVHNDCSLTSSTTTEMLITSWLTRISSGQDFAP